MLKGTFPKVAVKLNHFSESIKLVLPQFLVDHIDI